MTTRLIFKIKNRQEGRSQEGEHQEALVRLAGMPLVLVEAANERHVDLMEKVNGWKRTANASHTGDKVRSPAEEDGKGPTSGKDQQEEVI